MNQLNQPRYATLSIVMHWLMFLLLIAVYACIELRELYPKGSDPREALKTWHFMLGLSVFVLVWVRLFARWLKPAPATLITIPRWQQYIAKVMHIALYLLMVLMPIGGWLILSGEGKNIPFYGLNLPSLMAENKSLAKTIKDVHETAGLVGYYLIGLHALAGLFHHYVQRDNTLRRMLPKGNSHAN